MRLHRDERGQAILLVALSLPLMLGFVGIATDVGALFKDKRNIQTAADAAAIAGALNLARGTSFAYAAAQTAATRNGFTDGRNQVQVVPHAPPAWPHSNYHGKSGYFEVTITKSESTIFLSLFGYPSVTVLARAVATNQGPGSGCLYTVGPTGTGFTNDGTVDLEASSCGLVIGSSDPNAMVLNGNSDTIRLGSIGVVGGYNPNGSPDVQPTPVTGMAPESDPLNYLPQYSFSSTTTGKGSKATTTYTVSCASGYDCSSSPVPVPATCASTGGGSYNVVAGTTLRPGCYTSLNFPSGGIVTLSPGLYLIDGDLSFGSGTVTGSGVTFYYSGQLSFGSGLYTLSAPNDTTQLFNGVLFAESIFDPDAITFGGNSNTVIKGIVYAPGTSFSMHGNPGITLDADFVVHDITLSGNVSFTSYAALSGIDSPLSSIALVE